MFRKYVVLGIALGAGSLLALQNRAGAPAANSISLGKLANGATVAFVRASAGDWGIQIAGGASQRFTQPKPAQIQVFRGGDNVTDLASGYELAARHDAGVSRPWISVNHIHSIVGLEDFDKALQEQLAKGN